MSVDVPLTRPSPDEALRRESDTCLVFLQAYIWETTEACGFPLDSDREAASEEA